MPLISEDDYQAMTGPGLQPVGHPEGLTVRRHAFTPPPSDGRRPWADMLGQEGQETPTLGRRWTAAFEEENEIVAVAKRLAEARDFGPADPEHNPLDAIKGTPVDAYRELFLRSRNAAETYAIKARIERELENRRILENWGPHWHLFGEVPIALGGLGAKMVASILSPTTLLPFGVVRRGYQVGRAAGQSFLRTGAWGAGGIAIQEAALHSAQETRTLGESLVAMGGGFFIAGLLGAGASAFKSHQLIKASRAVDADLAMIRALKNETPLGRFDPARDGARLDPDEPPFGRPGTGVGADAGAAVARPIAENKLAGAFGLEKAFRRFNPLSRLIGSENRMARDAATRIAEMPMMLEQNKLGIPTGPEGGSVEARIKIDGDLALYRMQETMHKAFAEHRFQDADAWFSKSRAWIEGAGPNKLSYADFKSEVSRALREETKQDGIRHAIPEVKQAAEAIRRDVFNYAKDQAVELGLLPKDADFLAGYLMRRYDVPKILQERGRFQGILVEWLHKGQVKARRELEQLERQLGEIQEGSAAATSAGGAIARLKDEIAQLKARWEVDPAVVDGYAQMWSYVTRQAPKKPQTLAEWVRAEGGIKDTGKDVQHLMGGRKAAGRLVDNVRGSSLDDMTLRAWEQGFFGTRESRPTIREFLDLLDEDVRSGRSVREADAERLMDHDVAEEARRELGESGALATASEARARRLITGWLREQSILERTVRADLVEDRARLRDLEAQLGRAETDDERALIQAEIDKLRDQIGDVQAAIGEFRGDRPASALRSLDEIQEIVGRGETYRLPDEDVEDMLGEAVTRFSEILPAGARFGAPAAVGPSSHGPNYVRMDFRTLTGDVSLSVPVGQAYTSRALYIPEVDLVVVGGLRGRGGSGIDRGIKVGGDDRGFVSGVLHEVTHAVWRRMGPVERARLALHGDNLRILDMQLGTFLRVIGNPNHRGPLADRTLRDIYTDMYRNQSDLQDRLAQEAVAHMQELAHARFFSDEELAPVADLLRQMRGGATGEAALAAGRTDSSDPLLALMTPQEKRRSGFHFLSARKLTEIPDGIFDMGGQAVINWLRQAGVSAAEVKHFQLVEKLGALPKVTKEQFEDAIIARAFDFRHKTKWLNPERSPNDYDQGGTRAFTGPRVPGRGVYFERTMAFPKKTEAGDSFTPGQFESPHWEGFNRGTWASWRGSERDLPGWGKTVIGEEGQSDYMQGVSSGRRPRVSEAEFQALKKERGNFEKVRSEAFNLAYKAAAVIDDLDLRRFYAERLAPNRYVAGDDRWGIYLDELAATVERYDGPYKWFKGDAADAIAKLRELRAANAKFFAHDSFAKFAETERNFTPESPIDDNYVRTMVRDLLLMASQRRADSIAISTTATTARIQNSGRAAHFYDQQLKPSLEKELRRLTGDDQLTLQEVTLPKAQGHPRNQKAFTVWAAKLPEEVRAEIRDEGLPLFALGGKDGVRATFLSRLNEWVQDRRMMRRLAEEHPDAIGGGDMTRQRIAGANRMGVVGDDGMTPLTRIDGAVHRPGDDVVRAPSLGRPANDATPPSEMSFDEILGIVRRELARVERAEQLGGFNIEPLPSRAPRGGVDDLDAPVTAEEAVAYARELAARGRGENVVPFRSDRSDGDPLAALGADGEPPRPPNTVRFYHGADEGADPNTGGSRWVAGTADYARNFRRAGRDKVVWYVDIEKGSPEEIAARAWDEADEAGQTNMVGRYRDAFEVPEALAMRMRRLDAPDALADVEPPRSRPQGPERPEVAPEIRRLARDIGKILGIEVPPGLRAKSFDDQIALLEDFLAKAEKATAKAGRKAGNEAQDLLSQIDEIRHFVDADEQELKAIADESIDIITGMPVGRMINPFDNNFLEGPKGPLKARTLKIPDLYVSERGEAFADFLDDDIERIASGYVRSMLPDIALTREFGDMNMVETRRRIQEDASRRAIEAGDGPEAERIKTEAKRAERDLMAIAKRLRGTYNEGEDAADWGPWMVRRVKEANVLRLMGSVLAASISDPMKLLVAHGFRQNADLFSTLVTNAKGARLAMAEAKEMSAGLELVMSRAGQLWDAMDDFGGHSKFDRVMEGVTRKFGRITLMDPWNSVLKQLSGVMTANRVLRASADLAAGRVSAGDLARLAKSGIGPEMAEVIAEQYQKHGTMHGRLWLANAGSWDKTDMAQRAARALKAAVRREADTTIVTPGQERPLWTSGTYGSLIGQFRTFQLVTVQRTLIPAMQEANAAVIVGLAGMIGLGILSERLKMIIHGKENKDGPKALGDWLYAGIANGGVLGWVTDVDQTLHKVTRGNISAARLLFGNERPISRFASQNVAGSMLGPTFGAGQDLVTAFGGAASGDIRGSDIRAMRRLMPYQNLFWLSRALRAGEDQMIESLGIPETRRN